jgi:hypothetical protein
VFSCFVWLIFGEFRKRTEKYGFLINGNEQFHLSEYQNKPTKELKFDNGFILFSGLIEIQNF